MFTENDLKEIQRREIPLTTIEKQISNFKAGFPFINLEAPATLTNGLKRYTDEQTRELAAFYQENLPHITTLKFVPASGAATRMFSHLFSFRSEYKATPEQIQEMKEENGFNSVAYFFRNITQFAFYSDLKIVMQQNGKSLETCLGEHDYNTILDFLLYEPGLNYSALPKALIKFHQYADDSRTAIEEHLVEAANYSFGNDRSAHIHFTLSPEHIQKFRDLLTQRQPLFEEKFDVTYSITHSIQKPSTDTLAVDENNEPFRNADSSLLFRPGGHGALNNNLNEIEADVVFIKNIDNIVPDRLKPETNLSKMALAGCLLRLRDSIYEYLKLLENGVLADKIINQIITFAKTELSHNFTDAFYSSTREEKIVSLYHLLNRPIRVCGMVKNEGEPGGGPFIVRDADGNLSLQIIESSQIDMSHPNQKSIAAKATHFNPVDLVCSVKDHKGIKFDLTDFVDPSTGFISLKTKDGKPLKAQELPGLWNGAMAKWNTVFVEVPIVTFNPVKTVNDLLRAEHL
jgi:hypothetical protein